MKTPCFLLCAGLFLSDPTVIAGVISIGGPITDDASSGIDSSNVYTHTISGGGEEIVNGVTFELLNSNTTPANLEWMVSSTKNQINDNNGEWLPATGGVTGPGIAGLLGSFTYNSNGAAGSNQTFTLTGLTPGQSYETRLYCRKWSDTTERRQEVVFTAGAQEPDSLIFSEDRAEEVPLEMPSRESAYYISYLYTADPAGSLDITFTIEAHPGAGSFHMYGLSNQAAPGLNVVADPREFSSTVTPGDLIATLTGLNTGTPEATEFTFVAGEGDDDNGKFQIAGDELQAGTHDFGADPDGSQYLIRVQGVGSVSAEIGVAEIVLTLSKDSDMDNLPDDWELANANDLTELNGLGGANFDNDTLTDLEEYQISTTTFPGINPKLADSDGDQLEDGAEIAGADMRPPTDPTDADTDDDDLDDNVETNTTIYVSASDTGSDPTNADTDDDLYPDGVEVAAESDPNDAGDQPALGNEFFISGAVTDLVSSEISSDNTYTHAISGGSAQTVNGVVFEQLSPAVIPSNFTWDTDRWNQSQVLNNAGDWVSEITDPDLNALFRDFTYSGSGANPDSFQTFTLSGLTPGETYDLRLYIRIWDTEGSGRPISLTYTNGAEVTSPSPPGGAPEDRPGTVIGSGNDFDAYFISYTYTAETTEVSVRAQVPASAPGNSGSFHMYALTNQVASGSSVLRVTNIDYTETNDGPMVTLAFVSRPGATYKLYASTSLTEEGTPGGWFEVNDSIPSDGTETVYVDTVAARFGEPRLFYQFRESDD